MPKPTVRYYDNRCRQLMQWIIDWQQMHQDDIDTGGIHLRLLTLYYDAEARFAEALAQAQPRT